MTIKELIKRARNSPQQIKNYLNNRCFCGENYLPSLYLPTKKSDRTGKRVLLYCNKCR